MPEAVKTQLQNQFSMKYFWSRAIRFMVVITTWVGANGLPGTSPIDWQTWALLLAAGLGSIYTGGGAPQK
jgi:hypothetical protein